MNLYAYRQALFSHSIAIAATSWFVLHSWLCWCEGRINPFVNEMSRQNSKNAIDVWTWYCYDDAGDTDLWARWYHAQSARTRGQHRQIFEALEQREAFDWRKPLSKNLSDGLIEIYVRSEVQWRLFGFYWPKQQRRSFTIVLIGYHKGKIYTPPDAINQARKRKRDIENGTAKVRNCDRPKEADELQE